MCLLRKNCCSRLDKIHNKPTPAEAPEQDLCVCDLGLRVSEHHIYSIIH